MSAFLTCGLCGVRAVNGFLSRHSWGHVDLNPRGALQACPVCMEKHPSDWQVRLRDAVPDVEAAAATIGRRDPYGRNWSFS